MPRHCPGLPAAAQPGSLEAERPAPATMTCRLSRTGLAPWEEGQQPPSIPAGRHAESPNLDCPRLDQHRANVRADRPFGCVSVRMSADRDAPPDQTATCAAPKKAANYVALGEALPAAASRCTSASIAYGDRQRLGYETSNCAQLRDRHANSNIVEILGVDVASSEDGAGRLAGWLALPRGLVARGLSGVALVISDDQLAPALNGQELTACSRSRAAGGVGSPRRHRSPRRQAVIRRSPRPRRGRGRCSR